MIKKYLALLLLVPVLLSAQFRMADLDKDTWNTKNGNIYRYDKVEHFAASATLTHLAMYASEKHGWKGVLALGFLWEVKDGLVGYEKHGKWGGEGFSITDMSANMMGVATGYLFHKG